MIMIILIATLVSCIIYVMNKEITTKEFITMTIATIAGVLLVWSLCLIPIPNDKHFKSGTIFITTYHPYFVEEYTQPHTMCTSTGKTTVCTTYYTTERDKHHEYWTVEDTLGREWKVSKARHNEIKQDFGNRVKTSRPNKCTHGGKIVSGDPNLYSYWNETRTYKYPTNKKVVWHNPLKRTTTIFSGKNDLNKKYPESLSYETSNRLLEEEKELTRKDWDMFNSKVYDKCLFANVILTKIKEPEEASKLEAIWINGKQNDLVICIQGTYKEPKFVKVFGWSDSSLVKRKLETYILDNGITRDNLNELVEVIRKDYIPYDFNEFKYLILTPPLWIIFLAFIVACIIGRLCYNEFSTNWDRKED